MRLGNLVLWIAIMSLLLVTPAMRGGGQPLLAQQPAGEGAASTETSAAAEVAGAGLKIGVVDFEAVRGGWSVVQELQKQKDFVQRDLPQMMRDEWGYRGTLVFLTEDEVDEAVQLWRKGRERAAAESEQKRLDALDQEAENRARKFQDLVGKETLTEDEKREFGFLREIRNGREEQLQQLEDAYGRNLAAEEQRYQDADRRALDELRKAAQRVGERRGLDYVFTKEALLFGGVDITQDVIDDLQANVPALAKMGGGVEEEGAAP